MRHDNRGFPASSVTGSAPPVPGATFHWTRETWGHALRCEPLLEVTKHLFTSRQLEFPTGAGEDQGAGVDQQRSAWAAAAGSLGVGIGRLRRVTQVHGRSVRVVKSGEEAGASWQDRPNGDAIVSNARGLVLAVMVADCVPVLLADRRRGVAGAVHAGWRGTCAGIAREVVNVMVREFRCEPSDLVAAIGPSIGPDDYEVGEAVRRAFGDAGYEPDDLDRWFARRERDGVLVLDLWKANVDQLVAAGLGRDAVFVSGLNTMAHPAWLESFRRDGERAGRMAALIAVPEETAPR
jgi:polyphenol oxidase